MDNRVEKGKARTDPYRRLVRDHDSTSFLLAGAYGLAWSFNNGVMPVVDDPAKTSDGRTGMVELDCEFINFGGFSLPATRLSGHRN